MISMRHVGLFLLLYALSCGGEQLRVRPAYLTASTDVVDFGEVSVGDLEERTLFIINKGDATLDLEEPTGETLGGIFALVLPSNEIDANADVVARVFFQPSRAASFETTMVIGNNSTNESRFQVTMRGVGINDHPCDGVICNEPPPSACYDFETSRYYPPFGTCVGGSCAYEYSEVHCENGCDLDSGLCIGDPCLGVACQTPPNSCFFVNGVCSNGACVYTANDGVHCTDDDLCTLGDVCDEGACRGTPRQCNSPPVTTCAGSTLHVYDPVGVCNPTNGECQYGVRDIPCTFGCEGAECRDDPCAAGCDDANDCTDDWCEPAVGCHHDPRDGANCIAPSGDCPIGRCTNDRCLSVPDTTCVAEYKIDLCMEVDIAGVCSGNGECVVDQAPAQFTCPGCPGLCFQCFFQICIPF